MNDTALQHPTIAGTATIPPQRTSPEDLVERDTLKRRGERLEWLTTAANTLEAGAGILAGIAASSIALTAFGLGAVVEIAASLVVLWSLRSASPRSEKVAVTLLAGAWAVIGAGTLLQGVYGLYSQNAAEQTLIGALCLVASVSAMLTLGWLKVRTGRKLGSGALEANGRITLADGFIGGGVLLGLVLTLLFGWWWVDGVCALLLGAFMVRSGMETWQEAREVR